MTNPSHISPERAHQLLSIANGLPIDRHTRLVSTKAVTPQRSNDAPFTAAERDYLATQAIGRVATSRNEIPDVAPVRFRLDNDTIQISGLDPQRTVKFHNVLANRQASFVVDDMISERPWLPRGIKITGTAGILGHGSDAIISIAPQTVWSWGINDGAEVYFGPIEKRSVAASA